jgi:ornithine carbamoyltransferase
MKTIVTPIHSRKRQAAPLTQKAALVPHFMTGTEFSRTELVQLLDLAEQMKIDRLQGNQRYDLQGQTVILLFEKPSLRTRVSFTVAVQELGGNVLEIDQNVRKKEEPEDTIRVLGGYAHAVMVRTFEHSILERMVEKSPVPVINGLSDSHHPCQVLADLQTLRQSFGELKGLKLTYVGDGNNMLHSLLLLAPFLGVSVSYACPEGYQPDPMIVALAKKRARGTDAQITGTLDPVEAVRGANAVYTDVWASMGFEDEAAERDKAFAKYALTETLYSHAAPGALIMHCMPMIRDKEIASSLVDHECSALFRQSENRMHAQKALLSTLLGRRH